jgi:hypothetical protein
MLRARALTVIANSGIWIDIGDATAAQRMIAYDQTFKEATIYLDGSSFYRCRFERCTVVINGYLGCTLVDPKFVDCRWQVSGPADTTFQLLSALYQAGATDLIEATFNAIRGGRKA